MTNQIFSQNLRQLRTAKKMTQEQLADILGVSVQSVSRWECGNTLPDVMLLPQIARLYGVTVDDLYREETRGYANYAQRLLAVFESSGRCEDFLAAEQEFSRMAPTDLTADDLRSWGVLYHYMTKQCATKAIQKLEEAMSYPEAPEQVYTSAAQQKMLLLNELGKGQEEVTKYDQALKKQPEDPKMWLLCAAAHEFVQDYAQALGVVREGISRFPEKASLYVHAGDICRTLGLYDEAFAYWRQALALDDTFLDAMYSTAFCQEELGNYREAYIVWSDLVKELDRRGLVIERDFPAGQAQKCKARLE